MEVLCVSSQSNQNCTHTGLGLSTSHLHKEDHNPLQLIWDNIEVILSLLCMKAAELKVLCAPEHLWCQDYKEKSVFY